MRRLSPKQVEMLRSFNNDAEATDLYAFDGPKTPGHFAWANRERVIDALMRKGLLNEEGITDAGRATLEAYR